MKNVEELNAIYDSRASFYGKALVKKENNKEILYSYLTPVAILNDNNNTFTLTSDWDYSATTLRHVKEFMNQNNIGMDVTNLTKKNIKKLIKDNRIAYEE